MLAVYLNRLPFRQDGTAEWYGLHETDRSWLLSHGSNEQPNTSQLCKQALDHRGADIPTCSFRLKDQPSAALSVCHDVLDLHWMRVSTGSCTATTVVVQFDHKAAAAVAGQNMRTA